MARAARPVVAISSAGGIIAPLLLVALAGCRSDPSTAAHVEMLAAERRTLEDQLYDLSHDLKLTAEELEQAQRANQQLRERLDRGEGDLPEPPERPEEFDVPEPPRIEIPEDDLNPPDIEIPTGNTAARPGVARALGQMALRSAAKRNIKRADADTRVERISLDEQLTGGADFERFEGHEGLSVVVLPRSDDDRYVPRAAKMAVVALDPEKKGDAARIARWDFSEEEVAKLIDIGGPGIRLHMDWPSRPPENDRLHVFVRYITDDGRKLHADQEVDIQPRRRLSERWTPRPADQRGPLDAGGSRVVDAAPPPSPPEEEPAAEPQQAERRAPEWAPYR